MSNETSPYSVSVSRQSLRHQVVKKMTLFVVVYKNNQPVILILSHEGPVS